MDTRAAIREQIEKRAALPDRAICRELRRSAGLSQKQVADAVGVSRELVTKWEAGERNPYGDARNRYAEALLEMAQG